MSEDLRKEIESVDKVMGMIVDLMQKEQVPPIIGIGAMGFLIAGAFQDNREDFKGYLDSLLKVYDAQGLGK